MIVVTYLTAVARPTQYSKCVAHLRNKNTFTYQKKNHILHIMEKAARSSPNSTPFCGIANTSNSLQSDWMAFNSGTGTSSSQFFRLNSSAALTWLSNSWFIWLKSNEMYVPPDHGELLDLFHLFNKLRLRAILLKPRIDVRMPAKILVIIINHAYSGDRRGRGDSQVLYLEEQRHLVGHNNTIIIYQRQYLKTPSF